MNLIDRGSLTVEITRLGCIVRLTISRDEIIVDLYQVGTAYDLLSHFLAIETEKGEVIRASKRGERWRSNIALMTEFLSLFRGIEEAMVDKGKTATLRFRGNDVLKIGRKGGILPRFLGFKHMTIPDKMALMALIKEFWLSGKEATA